MTNEYICALSGKPADEKQCYEGNDELGDLPVGWTKITIQTRKENHQYGILQMIKRAMVDQLADQIEENSTKEEKEIARRSIYLQIEAQFAPLEMREDYSPFLIDETVIHVSNTQEDKQVAEAWNSILDQLDLVDEEEQKEASVLDEGMFTQERID